MPDQPLKTPRKLDLNLEDTKKTEEKSSAESVLPGVDLEVLAKQCESEYNLCFLHQKSKIQETLKRLKLYNNQRRDKEAVGDTTMFTIFQTVFSSLYDDRLMVEFAGKEEGDNETADNLTAVAKTDYVDMEKDILDYNWDFDTLFTGRGLILMEEWVRDTDNNIFIPMPEALDAVIFLRDPVATSVNGDSAHKGAMRFGGIEVKLTRSQMENTKAIFSNLNFEEMKYGRDTYSLIQDAESARNEAQNRQDQSKNDEKNLGENAQYTITTWWTHVRIGGEKGEVKKVKLWLANDRSKIIGAKVIKRDYWPIVDRPLYPTSHDWDGTSIPDLTEDKQRARAVASNLGMKLMKADLEPMYAYNKNRVTNKGDLSFGFNKFIGFDLKTGESLNGQIQPLNKPSPNLALLDFIYTSLDVSAQKATATPDIKMGMQSQQDRPLGETNLISANVDTRYSLAAKVFGWSDKRFWQLHWYNMYKDNFAEDIDEKVLRIVGAFGSKWRKLSKKDLICNIDPDVIIESTTVSRAKNITDRNGLTQYFSIALVEPTVNRRYGLKKLGRMYGLEKDEIDRLFPQTVDERMAEKENQMLNDDKLTPVQPEDDHNVHMEVHASAKDTNATRAHLRTHEEALLIKKVRPELFPADQSATSMNEKDPAQAMANAPMGQTKPVAPSQAPGMAA